MCGRRGHRNKVSERNGLKEWFNECYRYCHELYTLTYDENLYRQEKKPREVKIFKHKKKRLEFGTSSFRMPTQLNEVNTHFRMCMVILAAGEGAAKFKNVVKQSQLVWLLDSHGHLLVDDVWLYEDMKQMT